MPNDIPQPGDWKTKEYDDFMIREKQLNKAMRGAGSALNQSLETYDFPDSVIDASAIKPGSLLGDFRIANGSLSSRDYGRFGMGWSLNSDGTMDGFAIGGHVNFVVEGSTIPIQVADGRFALSIPAGFNGKTLTAALATIHTIGTSGTTTIQVRRRRGATSADMLSTRITVSYNEYYAADGVINTSNDDVATGDQIYIDVDTIASGSPKGLSVVLTFS